MTTLVGVGVVALKPALASSFEWMVEVYLTTDYGLPLQSATYATTTYTTHAEGYYELRTVYFSTCTASGPWTEWTNCRREGILSGEEIYECRNQLPTVLATSMFYVRASTNYSGCGTWTPTPDEVNCGGTMTKSYTIIP